MKSRIVYNKNVIYNFGGPEYYNIKNQKEPSKFSAITDNKSLKVIKNDKVFSILKHIYQKNANRVFLGNKIKGKNTHLLNLVARVPLLIVAYINVIREDKFRSLLNDKSNKVYASLSMREEKIINLANGVIDSIDISIFEKTSSLIKAGKYIWGKGKTLYFHKPVLMDIVVQEAIKLILLSVYEPYFDRMNCSFGSRPNRSVHDAIYALTNPSTASGLDLVLQGSNEFLYYGLNSHKIIQVLEKEISDKRFLSLIRDRLNFEFYDSEKDMFLLNGNRSFCFIRDVSYIFNIYMLEFDSFVTALLKEKLKKLNEGVVQKRDRFLITVRNLYNLQKSTISKILAWIHRRKKENNGNFKANLLDLESTDLIIWGRIYPMFKGKLFGAKTILRECNLKENSQTVIKKILQEKLKRVIYKMKSVPSSNENKKQLRFIYCRYVNDWIILSNMKESMLDSIKLEATNYLVENLHLSLSKNKTFIKKICKESAYFAGFEIKSYRSNEIARKMSKDCRKFYTISQKMVGCRLIARPDKQKLLYSLYKKGFCYKDGYPVEQAKLSKFETFTIIQITNSTLIQIVNYYSNYITKPRSNLSRWVYIVRYSCFKTLALKYKSTVKKIMEKFNIHKSNDKKQTIENSIIFKFNGKVYGKKCKLHTLNSLLKECLGEKAHIRKKEVIRRFLHLNKGILPEYQERLKDLLISSPYFLFFEEF